MCNLGKLFVALVFSVIFYIPLTSRANADTTPPVVNSFSISPETVDTTSSSQIITLTMSISDDSSGVCTSSDCNNQGFTQTQARFQSIGNEILDFWDFTRISGDDKSGTYVASATLPQGSRQGPWMLEYIYAVDKVYNMRTYGKWVYPATAGCGSTGLSCVDDLYSSIPGITGTVIGNSGSANSFLIDSDYVMINPLDGTKVTYYAGTTITRQDGGLFELYKLINQEATVSGLTTNGLGGNVAEVMKLGIPDLKLSFSTPVRIDLKVNDNLSGKKLLIKSLGEGDSSWANEGTCTVKEDVCTFTVSHASYFAAVSKKKIKSPRLKLSVKAKSKVKKPRVKLRLKTNKNSFLRISVNGNTQITGTANKKGKYTTWANLDMGKNTIEVFTTNNIGTAGKAKSVVRK